MMLLKKPDIEKAFNEIREYIKICEDSKNNALHQLEEYNKDEKNPGAAKNYTITAK